MEPETFSWCIVNKPAQEGTASCLHLPVLPGTTVIDNDTIQRARSGDTAAWETLMRAHQEALFRLSYLILGDPDDAADNVQETFLRAHRYLERYDDSRPLLPWLFSIAANLAKNQKRSVNRFLLTLQKFGRQKPVPATLEHQVAQNIEVDRTWQAIRRLSAGDQAVIYLRYFMGLSVSDTAQALDTAPGTIKSRCCCSASSWSSPHSKTRLRPRIRPG